MIAWGILACAMIWVRSPLEFYTVRFLLGMAEAGFFPGASLSDHSAERCGYAAFGLALSSLGCVGAAIAPISVLRVAALALIPIASSV